MPIQSYRPEEDPYSSEYKEKQISCDGIPSLIKRWDQESNESLLDLDKLNVGDLKRAYAALNKIGEAIRDGYENQLDDIIEIYSDWEKSQGATSHNFRKAKQ